jgi:hypothetical protein
MTACRQQMPDCAYLPSFARSTGSVIQKDKIVEVTIIETLLTTMSSSQSIKASDAELLIVVTLGWLDLREGVWLVSLPLRLHHGSIRADLVAATNRPSVRQEASLKCHPILSNFLKVSGL